MKKDDIMQELRAVWGLNKDTTEEDIDNYYYTITNIEDDGKNTENKVLYVYDYILNNMLRDGDITRELVNEIYNDIKAYLDDRKSTLLKSCISYIDTSISSYSDMLETFKNIGFTDKELLYYGIRDLDFEEEIIEKTF